MKEVILYVYASYDEGHLFVSVEPLMDFGDFKGRMIGVTTDLPYSASYTTMAKEGEVVCDMVGGAWLVVELCDSAMKSFQ